MNVEVKHESIGMAYYVDNFGCKQYIQPSPWLGYEHFLRGAIETKK